MKTDKQIIREWPLGQDYGNDDVLFIDRLRDQGLSDSDIVKVISVVDGICLHCFDDNRGCYCTRDD